jgi:hypothetical protein
LTGFSEVIKFFFGFFERFVRSALSNFFLRFHFNIFWRKRLDQVYELSLPARLLTIRSAAISSADLSAAILNLDFNFNGIAAFSVLWFWHQPP